MLDFICSNVAIKYCETGRAASFIPDILKLNIPEFLVPDHDRGHVTEVSDHFKAFLSSYIAKNRVTKDLMENMNHICTQHTEHTRQYADRAAAPDTFGETSTGVKSDQV